MSCRRDLIDGTYCIAMRAELRVRRLDQRADWKGARLHCECESGHRWHEILDDDKQFVIECDCVRITSS